MPDAYAVSTVGALAPYVEAQPDVLNMGEPWPDSAGGPDLFRRIAEDAPHTITYPTVSGGR